MAVRLGLGLAAILGGTAASEDDEASSCTVLRPGEAHVVDGFLTEAELEGFVRLMGAGEAAPDRKYGTDFEDVDPSEEDLPFVWSVMEKMRAYAENSIKSQSQHTEGPWAFKGSYYPDLFTLRRYGAMAPMKAHMDTGSYGRCLSGALHLGDERGSAEAPPPAERGGRLQLYGCRGGCRPWRGWSSRESYGPQPPEDLGEAEELELRQEVDHKPGRLVLFLAETPHGVSRVAPGGERNVLFVWFACEATLSSGAASLGHVELVDLLLQGRADVGEPDAHGQRPLAHASNAGHLAVVRQLLSRRAVTTTTDERGLQPLHLAASFGRTAVVEELLGADASPTALTRDGDSPSSIAAMAGRAEVLGRLLELRAASVEGGGEWGRDLLSTAIRAGHVPVAELLLASRADVDRLDQEEGRPLFWAAWTGHRGHVQRLLEGRASPESWSNYRRRKMLPIHVAAESGHEEVVRLLLAAGASSGARKRAASLARAAGHRGAASLLGER